MKEAHRWIDWFRTAITGSPLPLDVIGPVARVQVAFAAALVAALLDVLSAWIGWLDPHLREQYAAANVAVAHRLGYSAIPMDFAPLGVFASSLFDGSIAALVLWGLGGIVAVRGVVRASVGIGSIATAAIVPLPLVSIVGVVVAVVQVLVGSVRAVPSLGALLDPATANVQLLALASKVEIGSVVHAAVMARVLLPSHSWKTVSISAAVAFLVRFALIAGGVFLVARSSGLSSP
jgi:hypothetical protein